VRADTGNQCGLHEILECMMFVMGYLPFLGTKLQKATCQVCYVCLSLSMEPFVNF
jgi:hypothetical protein